MNILFEPAHIGKMVLRNRFVRSATFDACAGENGEVSEKQVKLIEDLAKGGVGLIILGITYVGAEGQISPVQNALTDDRFIPGMRELTTAANNYGAKIGVQLFHAGRDAGNSPVHGGKPGLAPSLVENDPYFQGPHRSMTEKEILRIVTQFGDAARRAKEAAFDCVQVHGAHAYLLSQFLSPHSNRRPDRWGGSLSNRLRFHREVYYKIRDEVGPDYPVLIKLGLEDGFEGGLKLGEGLEAAEELARLGFDALEISQGLRGSNYEEMEFRTKAHLPDREAYFREWARQVKNRVSVPVIMVGGLRRIDLIEEVVQKKEADFVALSRPLIREPEIIREWERGSHREPACISCNKCLEHIRERKPLQCWMEKKK